MAHHTKQHDVPVCYLKRFASNDKMIFAKLPNGEIKEIPYEDQCQKRNLYDFGENNKGVEQFLGKQVEQNFDLAMSRSLDKSLIPSEVDLFHIQHFVLAQYFRQRTLKEAYDDATRSYLDGDALFKRISFGLFTFLQTKKALSFNKHLIEIYEAPEAFAFYTSNSPAEMWHEEDGALEYVLDITSEEFIKRKNSCIVIPVSPKYLIISYFNKILTDQNANWDPVHKTMRLEEFLEYVDRPLEHLRPSKVLYASTKMDLY